MNEPLKTMLLAGLAVVLVVWASVVSIDRREKKAGDRVGEMLVDIKDPLDVTGIKIITFDSKTGQQQRFEVLKTKDGYIIPSNENYPADAEKHLGIVTKSVNMLKIAGVTGEGNLAEAEKEFGVVDPESSSLKVGSRDAGMRVILENSKKQSLADFIIGREVEDMPGLRYVRETEKPQVYTTKIDTQSLSTKFEDWIFKDLLKLDPLELKQVVLMDYSVETGQEAIAGPGGLQLATVVTGLNERSRMDLTYDSKELKWKLDKWMDFKDRQPVAEKLQPDQELNQPKLDELKSALDDLQIADVRRKPPGLGDNIQEFALKDPLAYKSLTERGFYPMKVPHPESGERVFQLLSDQGEVLARTNDGVEYILRFGGAAGGQAKDAKKDDKDKDDKKITKPGEKPAPADPASPTKLLRYLFVMAKFNENAVAKPELETVPVLQGTEAAPAKAEPKADAKGDGKKEEGKKEDASKDEAKKGDTEKAADKKKEEAKPDLEAQKKRRKEIIKANEVKQKAYEQAVAAGKKRAADLNKRFAPWYYVISDETYQKIHLGQKDIIQKKPPKEAKPAGPGGPAGLPGPGGFPGPGGLPGPGEGLEPGPAPAP